MPTTTTTTTSTTTTVAPTTTTTTPWITTGGRVWRTHGEFLRKHLLGYF